MQRGEIFAFLGPNGAGKTTTISMICGLLKKDSGTITIDGCQLESDPKRYTSLIGLCPQDIIVWGTLTCQEQLEFTGQLYGLDAKIARSKAMDLLQSLGLLDKRHAIAKTLSGGMKRKLNIALALVHSPPVLILDEPQAGLDPQSKVMIREYIRLLTNKTTVILTTHDMDEAERLADRVAIMDHGSLLVLDTPEKLKNQNGDGDILEIIVDGDIGQLEQFKRLLPKGIKHVTCEKNVIRIIGKDIPSILPEIIADLGRLGLKVDDMSLRRKSLEDIFIQLTGRRLRE